MKLVKKLALFSLGGGAYVGLELLYRGFSHVSMFAAGGTCFLLLGQLEGRLLSRAFRGAGIATAVELIAGLLVNRDFQIWDYRDQPGNFLGQICPMFTALWVPVSLAAVLLYRWADGALDALFPPAQKRSLP